MQFKKIYLCLIFGLLGSPHLLAAEKASAVELEVIDPYVEVHSGPGRGYPVFYVIEQGESVEVITRRPGWYEIRTKDGKTGWTTTAQISRTIQTTGEPADLPTVSYGDYLKNRWRVGFNTGQFMSGELKSSELFSFTAGYRPFSWLGGELEGGKLFGSDVKGEFYGANLLAEPFSSWKVSPFLLLGGGVMAIDSQPKLVPLEIEDSDYYQYGIGFNYYLGRNFLFKTEYRSYTVSTDNDDVSLESWTIGFNTFF